ncbi:ATP-binding protein [Zoogloea sp.]|uniref:ATP-binding protein n=1 Tax=Zoogloea sp. TaxID=49181 RepID=UPI0026307331|nr:ATP-binding protein [Zoogloea sp.]MDD3352413.1 response regulator [Zoogloea sp.]
MEQMDSASPSTPEYQSIVLVVDDEAVNRLVLSGLLRRSCRVVQADCGGAALIRAAADPQPDLILLDIMMPDMDGFEVLAQLRANPVTHHIPVIFVTALSDDEHEQRGFDAGAADYIHKPIRASIVLARVRAQLEAKAAREMLHKNNLHLKHKVEGGARALEKAQVRLMQAEKMASLGQLAAGIAHEINNPIGFVGSNLGSLAEYLENLFAVVEAYEQAAAACGNQSFFAGVEALRQQIDYAFLREDALQLLKESRDGIDRVRKIVNDLKEYSHAGGNDWQWASLHEGIDSTLNIVRNELKYTCTVEKVYGDIPEIRCMPSQLNQVWMNLLVNAAHAIEGQGTVTIRTERVGEDSVRVSISDTGQGIPPENLTRIFEPFFTTKPVGKGTGLGLALSWGIVERHHGHIEVHSEVGRGSTFMVTLLITPPVAEDAPPGA